MTRLLIPLALVLVTLPGHAADPPEPPRPAQVVVVYNSSMPASTRLAKLYADLRDIPAEQVIGLDLPKAEQIDRETYRSTLEQPLVELFDQRGWWQRRPNTQGQLQVAQTKIRILVCIHGVPLKVQASPPAEPDTTLSAQQKMLRSDQAAVDSELAVLGNEGLPLAASLGNPYFKKNQPIHQWRMPQMLVGRIDGPTAAVCEQMMRDAVEAERTGLWGFATVDVANKLAQGDGWLQTIAQALDDRGVPTLIDRFDRTLPTHFPLPTTAIYFGWYDGQVSGPFVNPEFRFRPGAVAVHIHSFSAAQLRNPQRNWCAPLLAKGAAATLGNVYEPFLHLTHHLDVFADRLLEGYTLVEAAGMALPAVSWQGIVLGDPLYRPFLRLDGSGRKTSADRTFRALRIARLRWPRDGLERETQLRAAAGRTGDPAFLEAIGLHQHLKGQGDRASQVFRDAMPRYTRSADKLRMDLHIARIDRESQRREAAIRTLRTAATNFSSLPEVQAARAWLNVLDPPPPPPAAPPAQR